MADINTLIPDIYALVASNQNVSKGEILRGPNEGSWFTQEVSDALRTTLASRLAEHFNAERYAPGRATLRMSGLGPKCPRALWYSIHHPEMADPLPPWAEIKFAYGHVLEALCLALARGAGHSVLGEQDEVTLDGILGHRDGVVDGAVVDVKSCSSIQFNKIKSGALEQNDNFGYLDQLCGYVVGSLEDPIVIVKDRGYILAIDKVLGHLHLHEYKIEETKTRALRERIAYYKRVVELSEPPACECRTQAHGTSGNRKLAVPASYSPYKHCCFPGLRTFLYSEGPTYLTKVVSKPNVPEVNRYGQYVW